MPITVSGVRAELRKDSENTAEPMPRLSWIVEGPAGWMPAWSEVRLDEGESLRLGPESVLVPWPFAPLEPRSRYRVQVRVGDADHASPWSEPRWVTAAFLTDGEWQAAMIGLPAAEPDQRPGLVRTEFDVEPGLVRATLYATAHGVYQAEINGVTVDDAELKPGWTAYRLRLIHETTDVTTLLHPGRNAVGAIFAGGWYTERYLGRRAEFYGTTPAVAMQLHLDYGDGRDRWIRTGAGWTAAAAPITASGIYAGEDYDARLEQSGWSAAGFDDTGWQPARVDDAPHPTPSAQVAPPVRMVDELAVREVVTSAGGAPILDFGQNLVGRLRIRVEGPAGATVTLRHAEVLEGGELGTRPLRGARATDTYTLRGGGPEEWEPRFTFHGFRYAQLTGVEVRPDQVTAVVLSSDLPRTGWFRSSEPMLNRLHENVVWGMRGNFLSVPTDCPQRDERLGWTGDLQVFAPTASFLFDADAFLTSWLTDLDLEQRAAGGIVPFVVPDPLPDGKRPAAAWGDAATVVPTVLHERYGDLDILRRQLPSMVAWADVLLGRAGDALLWRGDFQFGDWLDPAAPPENPFAARTDPDLIASAYLCHSVELVARAARLVGDDATADRYGRLASRAREAFRHEFVSPAGRMSSDSPTAYAVAIRFGLYGDDVQRQGMGDRLADLVRMQGYRIATGFVGTPLVADALADTGHLDAAGRLLFQTDNPSWLYPVTMGATTIWERWDSMLEDGSINPGGMTSFNHYAFGAVADWLHRVVAGLAPAEPGYRTIRIAPRPLKHLQWAEAELNSPYGRVRVAWCRAGAELVVEADVPTGAKAAVELPGQEPFTVAGGSHRWTVVAPPAVSRRSPLHWMTTALSDVIDDEEAYAAIRATLTEIDPVLATQLRRQIIWSRGFTLDEVLRALSPDGRERVEDALAVLNRRAQEEDRVLPDLGRNRPRSGPPPSVSTVSEPSA
ncbi:alpha-L-rhamnosidase [Dactylosporangium matsuzakiense]|uniref:alpha-L-rhamnosidase n=1 Tax=Dactylosporangium matsuzakiense TaxID=53360 RepID=A0A9W6NTB8_9ACTN|nr:alpha-L-rhamnosidase [Dactylosporangium matsuzakiense]GLL08052.1 alpha-L-rhamnosidase [Dactylosporangium matsuzakiense]